MFMHKKPALVVCCYITSKFKLGLVLAVSYQYKQRSHQLLSCSPFLFLFLFLLLVVPGGALIIGLVLLCSLYSQRWDYLIQHGQKYAQVEGIRKSGMVWQWWIQTGFCGCHGNPLCQGLHNFHSPLVAAHMCRHVLGVPCVSQLGMATQPWKQRSTSSMPLEHS